MLPAVAIHPDFGSNCQTLRPARPRPTTTLKRKLLAVLLFPGFVWFLIAVLEPIATNGWLGPVPTRNLKDGFNASALFYTEIDLEDLGTSAGTAVADCLKGTDRP